MPRRRSIPSSAFSFVRDAHARGMAAERIAAALGAAGVETSRRSVLRLLASFGRLTSKTGAEKRADNQVASRKPSGNLRGNAVAPQGGPSPERELLTESIAKLRSDLADDDLPASDRARVAAVLAGLARRLTELDAHARAGADDAETVAAAADVVRARLLRLEAERARRLATLSPEQRAAVESLFAATDSVAPTDETPVDTRAAS